MLYSTTCHQIEQKSYNCEGVYFLVCARCTGIYLGSFTASVITIFTAMVGVINFKNLITFSFPMMLDVLFVSIGVYEYNKIIASATGFLFGSTIFLYILHNVEFFLNNKIVTK